MASNIFSFQADKRVCSSSLQAADRILFFGFLLLFLTITMLELPGFAVFVVLIMFHGVKYSLMYVVAMATFVSCIIIS